MIHPSWFTWKGVLLATLLIGQVILVAAALYWLSMGFYMLAGGRPPKKNDKD